MVKSILIVVLPVVIFFSCTPTNSNEKIKLPPFSKTPIYFTAQLDSTITKDTTKYFFVKAVFYNNTAGIIYFKSNTCSGPGFFITNNADIKFKIPMCFQSIDFWDTIPSFKSKDYPLVFSTAKKQLKEKFLPLVLI